MGMYTELIFEGITHKLDNDDLKLFSYFFGESEYTDIDYIPNVALFKCARWDMIGHMSSYYHFPMSVRKMAKCRLKEDTYLVFLRCDFKNYDNEIEKFLTWIRPKMYQAKIWVHYEEDQEPSYINW